MRFDAMKQRLMDGATVVPTLCALTLSGFTLKDRFSTVRQLPTRSTDTVSVAVQNWPNLIAQGHRIGPDNAPVTILEFGDFECPACRAVARPLHDLRQRYPNLVAVVFRNWPLSYHRFAYPAARAAECAAEQSKFVPYHDLLYALQDSLGLLTFNELARRAGISDTSAFNVCFRRPGRVKSIDDDSAAARAIGGRFTPTLVVNGWRLAGVPDSAQLEGVVQRALKTATGSLARVSPR